MAIVGLAEQFIFGKIDLDRYYDELEFFKEQVRRFNPVDNAYQSGFEPKSLGPSDYRIVHNERDFRFLLFRHWSLHDSMLHSSYVASKLGIWRERGRQKLHNLFAKMGFSSLNAQQPYVDMPIELRRDIYEHLEDNAVHYGLTELTFPSFLRYFGLKTVLSASDIVYCMTALMEAPPRVVRELGIGALNDDADGNGADRWISSAYDHHNKNNPDYADNAGFFGGFAGFYLAFDALYKYAVSYFNIRSELE
jgi:cell division control protein 45